jgi:hypothetical protein
MNRTPLVGASLAIALSFLALAAAPAEAHVGASAPCSRLVFSWLCFGREVGIVGGPLSGLLA